MHAHEMHAHDIHAREMHVYEGHWGHSASCSLFIRPLHRGMLSLGILMQQVGLRLPSLQLHEEDNAETPPA